jgi:mono/diheme cytochrome c family protein
MTIFAGLVGTQGKSLAHLALLGAVVGSATLAPACSASSGESQDETDTSGANVTTDTTCGSKAGCVRPDRVTVVGSLDYGETSDPVAVPTASQYRAFGFTGTAGDSVSVTVTATRGTAQVYILDSEYGILAYGRSTATKVPTTVGLALPSTGSVRYYVAFRESNIPGAVTFTTALAGPPAMTFATSRIAQSDVDNGVYSADQIFHVGDFLFGDHDYTVDEGLGNALQPPLAGSDPPPNARKIHNGKFGGPDSHNCSACHGVGGTDGSGSLADNLLQDGDGVNMSTVLVRNPRQVIGVGWVQQLGIEMTNDLQAQLAAAQTQAAGGTAVTVDLTSKGVSFGQVAINVDGVADFSNLQGVDKDLIVKPLGWKGRIQSVRRFVEGGFQVHLGMATQPLIAKHCKTPIPAVVGDGPDCTDPDNDGVRDEITEGQLTAMAIYGTLTQAPVRVPPTGTTALARAAAGEQLFGTLGCTSCHVQQMTLNSTVHLEAPDLTAGAPFKVDLSTASRLPRPAKNADGTVFVELFSDLKRHDMGASLADSHPTFGTFAASQFLTPPLWGVAASAPYLHDGRAATLGDAIKQHDGEGAAVRDAYLLLADDDQQKVVEFLGTLSRDPRHAND